MSINMTCTRVEIKAKRLNTVTTEKETILLTLGKDELYDMVSRHIEMVDGILHIINEDAEEREKQEIFH